jgi:hypothetical protein
MQMDSTICVHKIVQGACNPTCYNFPKRKGDKVIV